MKKYVLVLVFILSAGISLSNPRAVVITDKDGITAEIDQTTHIMPTIEYEHTDKN